MRNREKRQLFFFLKILLVLCTVTFFFCEGGMAYEEPVYTVIEKKGNIEIRRYEPYKLWFLRRNEVLIPVEKVPGD